eukprot:TRINITY_DN63259_c0_g1_i1.p1 TRINITY_DN63259_c0_g1~~TRINITY_DN63259_c0_g1_i1.p1  ORF type:complete len:488 (+),score=124.08 TRINITY_DN63259_c0_g1_i1:77-1540(+)
MPPKRGVAAAVRGAAKAASKAARGAVKAVIKTVTKRASAGGKRGKAEAAKPARLAKSKSSEALEKSKSARSGGGGKKVVDSLVPNASSYKVYEDYAVKLNQTNIGGNNNKFYVIQALQGKGGYATWNRWGRVGEPGQNKFTAFKSPEQAIKDFESKFRSKTGNSWSDLANFKPKGGLYSIVETEDAAGGGDSAPMGKLTEAQIGKGQAVLEKIQAALKKGSKPDLAALSSQFYTLIPHDFGRKVPPAITTSEMLEAKMELLKFYLRMGFEKIEEAEVLTPVDGVLDLPVPKTLAEAANSCCGAGSITTSSKKGDELAKKQVGKPVRKMTPHEYAAIMLYTSNAIYQDLNKALRDENRGKLKKYFKYLRLFFESMDALPKRKRKLWRGLSVDLHKNPQYKVGNEIVWWGVSSCTADINVAKGFAKGCGGKCTIITVESETASDISDITFYSNEKESLLCPGTQLKVKSNKMNGNVCEITLQEVGRMLN